jgi:hypothetical protein
MSYFIVGGLMTSSQQNFVTYNLNWLLAVENTAENTRHLDSAILDSELLGTALRELKDYFLGASSPLMMSAPARFIPIKDYVICSFDRQYQASLNEQVQDLATTGQPLSESFQGSTVIYDGSSFEYFDIAIPSLMTEHARKDSNTEFYVLPIKMTLLEGDSEKAILHIGALLNEEKSIKEIISIFESSSIMKQVFTQTKRIAFTPLLAENSLRIIITDIRRITRRIKNGKSY